MSSTIFKPRATILVALLAPAALIFVLIAVVPLLASVGYSFLEWSGGPKKSFIGLANYVQLATDRFFWASFRNNVFLVVLCVIGQIGIGFLAATLLRGKTVRFGEVHRALIFFPVVISAVVIGFMWSMIYNKDLGFLNSILRAVHLEGFILPYLDDPKIVMTFVSIPIVWQYIGLYMLIFLTGYQGIDPTIFEVAQLDGAGPFVRAFKITLPLLSSTFKVALMLCVSGNMKIFDHIFVMTGGGPGRSSMVMAMYAYNQTFEMFKLGYASAISTAIMLLSFALIGASRILLGRNGE